MQYDPPIYPTTKAIKYPEQSLVIRHNRKTIQA